MVLITGADKALFKIVIPPHKEKVWCGCAGGSFLLNETLVNQLCSYDPSVSLSLSRGLCVTHQRLLSTHHLTWEEQTRRRRQLSPSLQWYHSTPSTEGE